jgi:hypothetical protein
MMRRSGSDFRKIDCVFSLTGGEHVLPIPYQSKRALDIAVPLFVISAVLLGFFILSVIRVVR